MYNINHDTIGFTLFEIAKIGKELLLLKNRSTFDSRTMQCAIRILSPQMSKYYCNSGHDMLIKMIGDILKNEDLNTFKNNMKCINKIKKEFKNIIKKCFNIDRLTKGAIIYLYGIVKDYNDEKYNNIEEFKNKKNKFMQNENNLEAMIRVVSNINAFQYRKKIRVIDIINSILFLFNDYIPNINKCIIDNYIKKKIMEILYKYNTKQIFCKEALYCCVNFLSEYTNTI